MTEHVSYQESEPNMWFLEVYFKDGTEVMRVYPSYTELKDAEQVISDLFNLGEIAKFVSYFIIGNVESSPVTTYP